MVGDDVVSISGREFPEQYSLFKRLYEQSDETALLWHAAHNAGWTISRISDWMKKQRKREPWIGSNWVQQRRNLDADKEMRQLFHDFALRCTDMTIRYPSGDLIYIMRKPIIFWNIDNRTLSESELQLDASVGAVARMGSPGQ